MYPRPLTDREREWIEWILPDHRPGYHRYRELIRSMSVVGEGRRGEGELILARAGQEADFSAPLSPVFAYGVVETTAGIISITIREVLDDQISLEIVNNQSDDLPDDFRESRRWTYSAWSPGDPCPQCGRALREVLMHAATERKEQYVLALCSYDRRLWVFDESDGVSRLIPVTNFYNELMLHKNIRDPKIVVHSKLLFTELHAYTDADLTYAFLTYNKLKTKVHLEGPVVPSRRRQRSLREKLKTMFSHRVS